MIATRTLVQRCATRSDGLCVGIGMVVVMISVVVNITIPAGVGWDGVEWGGVGFGRVGRVGGMGGMGGSGVRGWGCWGDGWVGGVDGEDRAGAGVGWGQAWDRMRLDRMVPAHCQSKYPTPLPESRTCFAVHCIYCIAESR